MRMAPRTRGSKQRWRRRIRLVTSSVAAVALGGVLVSCASPTIEPDPDENARKLGRIAAVRAEGPPQRVLLITVAGLRADDFLGANGFVAGDAEAVRMPRMAELAHEGVVGLRAIPPSPGSSYASHATLVTGREPARHGVNADTRLADEGHTSVPFWDSRMLTGTALWDAAIGRGVLALGWPTTAGARIELVLPDVRVTEQGESWLDLVRGVSSPSLIRDLEEISADAIEEAKSLGKPDRDPASWPTPAEKDAAISELACNVVWSDRDPGLWLIRFDEPEAAQTISGSGSRDLAAALGRVDTEIGMIVDCLGEAGQLADTALFIVGDVAYQPVDTQVDPNVALVAEGLVGRDPRSSSGVRSWLALSRSNGRSAYVYARDAANAVKAREILEAEAESAGGFRVVPAAELAKAGGDRQAWFGLAAAPGYVIGSALTRPNTRPATVRASPGGLSFLDESSNAVGFLAWGRGIRGGVRMARLELVDVAPTIAMLLGLRLDDPLDGESMIGILRAAVPPPPLGPKRLGIDADGNIDRSLRDMGGGR